MGGASECGWEGALGRGKKRPTVGRPKKTYCRSPETTYRGSSMRPTVGRFRALRKGSQNRG
ncbi:hypothetical protein HMPREF1556_00606 [Porphyromonas sp. oral taxon 278 str. W7784]|nr:hypothetical protein HMPREF1556_00606 [Porphyromonas sp. oral taxon 278 str. W7784]